MGKPCHSCDSFNLQTVAELSKYNKRGDVTSMHVWSQMNRAVTQIYVLGATRGRRRDGKGPWCAVSIQDLSAAVEQSLGRATTPAQMLLCNMKYPAKASP